MNYDGIYNITKEHGNTWMLSGRELPEFPMRMTQMRIPILIKRFLRTKVVIKLMMSLPIMNLIHNHQHDK